MVCKWQAVLGIQATVVDSHSTLAIQSLEIATTLPPCGPGDTLVTAQEEDASLAREEYAKHHGVIMHMNHQQ